MDWIYSVYIFSCLGKHIYWFLDITAGRPIENLSNVKRSQNRKGSLYSNSTEHNLNMEDRIKQLKRALDYVNRLNASTCKNGTSDTLALRLDRTIWDIYAKVALNTANFVSKYLQRNSLNGSLSYEIRKVILQKMWKSPETNMDFEENTNKERDPQMEPLVQNIDKEGFDNHCGYTNTSSVDGYNSSIDKNLDNVSDILSMLYLLVQNNVDTSSQIIVGSALAVEPYVIPSLARFSPYAYKTVSNCIYLEDLAQKYNYMDSSVKWYSDVVRNLNGSQIKTESVNYGHIRKGSWMSQMNTYAVATLANGYWTNPYFDCGGGNIWMVTFSAPILWISPKRKIYFRGVATIDIELTNIDINQCDEEEGNIVDVVKGATIAENKDGFVKTKQQNIGKDGEAKKIVDIFRGTHSCQKTTTCVHISKCGFRRGCYICKCRDGYYFPYKNQDAQYFNGSEVEDFYGQNELNTSNNASTFQCLPCARYCDICIDSSPCMHQPNIALRVMILIMSGITLFIMVALAAIVCHKRSQLVIKSASPIFLLIMCLGGAIMSIEEFILYFEPTDLICQMTIWPKYLGFVIMYGSLILKTWRISIIFKEGKVKRVNLPDTALIQRMVPVLVVTIASLIGWSLKSPPQAVLLVTSTSLKYITCSVSLWTYAFYAAEAIMLLYSVYVCFNVRKVPASFNESRYITWSTYNTLILGSFLIIFQQFVKTSVGPDIMYLLYFLSLQIKSTITVGLIFIPKFYVLYKIRCGQNVEMDAVYTVTGRLIRQSVAVTNVQEKSSQTDEIYRSQEICSCICVVGETSMSTNSKQLPSNIDVPKQSRHTRKKSRRHHKKHQKRNRVEPTTKAISAEDNERNETI